MKKQQIKDESILANLYDWFNNQYEYCENPKTDAKNIVQNIKINKHSLVNDLAIILEMWLNNDNGFRLDYERDLGNQRRESIAQFINTRSKFFEI